MKLEILDVAQKELSSFDKDVQKDFSAIFQNFLESKIRFKQFKKFEGYNNLFEFRVKNSSGIYRAILTQIKDGHLIVLFFKKKTQKTPLNEIKTALRRIKIYKSYMK